MDIEENDDLDARLEMRLGDELRNQLDRHVGRAAPYFLKRCADRDNRPAMRGQGYAGRLAALTVAAAAVFAVFVAWQRGFPGKPPEKPIGKLVVAAPPIAAQEISGHHVDDAKLQPGEGADEGQPPSNEPDSKASGSQASAGEPLLVGRTLKTRTFNEGTLLVGRTPVRKVRRQWLERVEWFDPQNGARMQRIVPHEEVLFVPVPIN